MPSGSHEAPHPLGHPVPSLEPCDACAVPGHGGGIGTGLVRAVFRNVLRLPKAHSTEFDESSPDPVICLMPDQEKVVDKGATMRLGASDCDLKPGSLARKAYGADRISERHRHRYEFNNDYYARFEEAGLIPSGRLSSGKLVEIVELENHPWFLAVQFHPEFKSKLTAPHPLFRSFIEASVKRRAERLR